MNQGSIEPARIIHEARRQNVVLHIAMYEMECIVSDRDLNSEQKLKWLLAFMGCRRNDFCVSHCIALSALEVNFVRATELITETQKLLWLVLAILLGDEPTLRYQTTYQELAQIMNISIDIIHRSAYTLNLMDFIELDNFRKEDKLWGQMPRTFILTLPNNGLFALKMASLNQKNFVKLQVTTKEENTVLGSVQYLNLLTKHR